MDQSDDSSTVQTSESADGTDSRFYNAQQSSRNEAISYCMSHRRRGRAVIFNHFEFDNGKEPRHGTATDKKSLEEVLTALGFDVNSFDDAKEMDIMGELDKVSKEDHSDSDCLLIAVLTHGSRGKLRARDTKYFIDQLWMPFLEQKCPSLKGKPKLFIIQACRGTRADSAFPQNEVDGPSDSNYEYQPYASPLSPDFLVAFSSAPDHVSNRNRSHGSWFITALCKELRRLRLTKYDLLKTLTVATREVAVKYERKDIEGNVEKQLPCTSSTLTKLIYFTQ